MQWGLHHKSYVDNTNKQLPGYPQLQEVKEREGLVGVVKAAWNNGQPLQPLHNNAAQVRVCIHAHKHPGSKCGEESSGIARDPEGKGGGGGGCCRVRVLAACGTK